MIPLWAKAAAVAGALWYALREKPRAPQGEILPMSPIDEGPAPSGKSEDPELGKRWRVHGVTGTDSQREADAVYANDTGVIIAVLDNRTYDDDGDAVVVALPNFAATALSWWSGYKGARPAFDMVQQG